MRDNSVTVNPAIRLALISVLIADSLRMESVSDGSLITLSCRLVGWFLLHRSGMSLSCPFLGNKLGYGFRRGKMDARSSPGGVTMRACTRLE